MLKSKQNYQRKINQKKIPTTSLQKNAISSRNKNVMPPKPSIVKSNYKHSSKRQDFLYSRRQNYLNTCFNKRKNSLKQITKQNKKIYDRINSQKSKYNKGTLEKSYDSHCSSSRRSSKMSLSRNSRNSSKLSTSRNKNGNNKCFTTSQKKNVLIESKSISQMSIEQVMNFQQLFCLNKTNPNENYVVKPIKQRKNSENLRKPTKELEPIYESKIVHGRNYGIQKISQGRQLPLMEKKNFMTFSEKKLIH